MTGWLKDSPSRPSGRIGAASGKKPARGAGLDDYLSLSRQNPTQPTGWLWARRAASSGRVGTGVRKGERGSCEASRPPFGVAAAFTTVAYGVASYKLVVKGRVVGPRDRVARVFLVFIASRPSARKGEIAKGVPEPRRGGRDLAFGVFKKSGRFADSLGK